MRKAGRNSQTSNPQMKVAFAIMKRSGSVGRTEKIVYSDACYPVTTQYFLADNRLRYRPTTSTSPPLNTQINPITSFMLLLYIYIAHSCHGLGPIHLEFSNTQ